MTLLRRLIPAAAALVLAAPALHAAPLPLDEAVALALRQAEEVRIAGTTVEERVVDRAKALQSVTPDLSFSASWGVGRITGEGSTESVDDTLAYTVALNQPFYTGGRATSAMRMADRAIAAGRHTLGLTREGVYLAVVEAYLGALAADRVVEAARLGVTQASDFLALAKRRFELGEVTRTGVLRGEFEVARRQTALVEAEGAAALARDVLRRLVGRPVEELLEVPPEAWPPVACPVEELVARALVLRRELLIGREATGIAEEGVVSARGKFLPYLYGSAAYTRLGGDLPPGDTESWDVAVNLSLPLYDRGMSLNDLTLSRLALDKSRLQEEKLRKEIRLEVESRFLEREALARSVEGLRAQSALAEENHRGVRKQWEVGMATDLEAVTALLEAAEARVALARQEYALVLAGVRLRSAAGMLDLPAVAGSVPADRNDTTPSGKELP